MAEANRTPVTPEQRFARRFAAHHTLSPPVNVEGILDGLANVEYDDIPNGWDALTIRKPGERPRVVVSSRAAHNRKRFTLAHELGHIVLPWQYGSAFCQPEVTLVTSSDIYALTEAEANRFAAELLMPSDWLLSRLGSSSPNDLAQKIIEIGAAAGVSPISASIALQAVYPFPAATWITQNGNRSYVATSKSWPLNKWDESWLDADTLSDEGVSVTSTDFGDFTLYAATLGSGTSLTGSLPDAQSTEILREIVADLRNGKTLTSQVNGIVGSANNMVRSGASLEEAYQILRLRFRERPKLRAVVESDRFDDFLRAKANELVKRRSGG